MATGGFSLLGTAFIFPTAFNIAKALTGVLAGTNPRYSYYLCLRAACHRRRRRRAGGQRLPEGRLAASPRRPTSGRRGAARSSGLLAGQGLLRQPPRGWPSPRALLSQRALWQAALQKSKRAVLSRTGPSHSSRHLLKGRATGVFRSSRQSCPLHRLRSLGKLQSLRGAQTCVSAAGACRLCT